MTHVDSKNKKERERMKCDRSLGRLKETLAIGVTSTICVRRWSGHFRKALSSLGRGSVKEEGTRAAMAGGPAGVGRPRWLLPSVGCEEPGLSLRHPLQAPRRTWWARSHPGPRASPASLSTGGC